MELSLWHIVLLMIVVLLVFGAKRIPEIGSSLGQGIKEFKRSLKDVTDDRSDPRPPTPPTSSSLPPGGEPTRLSQ